MSYVSVCLSAISLHESCMNRSINNTAYSASDIGRKMWGFLCNCCIREVYSVKHEQIRYNGLTSSGSACSVYLEGTRSHNEGHISTPACYLLVSSVPLCNYTVHEGCLLWWPFSCVCMCGPHVLLAIETHCATSRELPRLVCIRSAKVYGHILCTNLYRCK